MPETSSLGLPLLVAEQAQKHVTHNEALRALDAIVQLAVLDRDLTAPPGSPDEGDRYIVGPSATGAWAGHDGEIAAWQDGVWTFYEPNTGWRAWVEDESELVIWTGAAWSDLSLLITVLQNLALLGVGTTADATNPFSAKLNKALWTAKTAAEGGDGDLRYTMNKETAADVLSLLLQTGFSGRAEVGLIGDDDLLFKVSPDGSIWHEALRIDKDNGELTLSKRAATLATSGAVLAHDPSADTYFPYNGFKFGFYYSTYFFPGAGLGGEDYANAVWGLGVNFADAGASRLDATKPSLGFSIESKFFQGGVYGTEFHLQGRDTANVNHRPLTGFFPHSGAAGTWGLTAGTFNFFDWSGAQKLLFDLTNSTAYFYGMVAANNVNNVKFIKQINAAGSTYQTLLYLDSTDRGRMEVPLYVVSGLMPASGNFADIQPTSMSSGNTALKVTAPAITGQGYVFQAAGAFTTGMDAAIWNNDNTNGTAYARLYIRVLGANGGDPYIRLHVNGATDYSLGIDNSDSDAFIIAASSALGTNNRVRIDANKVDLLLPPKVPSYTVAGVPSASTLGAGSLIYVSNEAGGATLAFSDGANWKRVSDLATIS